MAGARGRAYGQGAALLLTSVAAVVAFQPSLRGSALRVGAGVLLVFLLPGYALQSVLLGPDSAIARRTRLALSIGTSPAIVALVTLTLNELAGRITFNRTLTAVVLLTATLLGVSWFNTPRTHQIAHRPTADGGWTPRRQRLTDRLPRPALSSAISIDGRWQWALVGVAALLFVGLLAVPAPQQSYTELSLLTETEQGQLIADDYPETLAPGASASVVATVRNQEQTTEEYTLVVTRERVADGAVVVLATERFELADGELARRLTTLTAPPTAGGVRFTYRLYRTTDVPVARSGADLPAPYREARLLVTVRPPSDGASR